MPLNFDVLQCLSGFFSVCRMAAPPKVIFEDFGIDILTKRACISQAKRHN
jgi:hypothetical protein